MAATRLPAWPHVRSQLFTTLPYPTTSFTDQTIIVTGSNSGMGLEAARHFARLGAARVILAVRSPDKGRRAAESIARSTGRRRDVVDVWPLDLASYDSVRRFAARAASELDRLDVVVENAGVYKHVWTTAEDGETTVTVNLVSTMLLAVLLVPKLRETSVQLRKDVVLTFTGSFTHWMTNFAERDAADILAELADESKANMKERYATSKLMELLAVQGLHADLAASDKPGRIITSVVNPGFVKTSVMRESTGLMALFVPVMQVLLSRTAEVGARTLVHAAEGGRETDGQYLDDCQVKFESISPFVKSEEGAATQRKVWAELKAKIEAQQPGCTSLL